ncbi:MAG TPA: hypothetical protein VGO59_05435 [Verrucomicrobiae bacterium]|jgi:anti-sigma factor RsiW
MNACAKYREEIALMAAGALEPQRERELRAHSALCPGCGHYLAEIEAVAGNLRAAEPESHGQPSAAFHRNVMAALAARERRSAREWFGLFLNWRLALPAVSVLALVIAVSFIARPRGGKPAVMHVATAPESKANLEPTLSNYQWAANQSSDELDKLLTEQGERNSSPAAVYSNPWRPSLNTAD